MKSGDWVSIIDIDKFINDFSADSRAEIKQAIEETNNEIMIYDIHEDNSFTLKFYGASLEIKLRTDDCGNLRLVKEKI
jgi:hypothetical protein